MEDPVILLRILYQWYWRKGNEMPDLLAVQHPLYPRGHITGDAWADKKALWKAVGEVIGEKEC